MERGKHFQFKFKVSVEKLISSLCAVDFNEKKNSQSEEDRLQHAQKIWRENPLEREKRQGREWEWVRSRLLMMNLQLCSTERKYKFLQVEWTVNRPKKTQKRKEQELYTVSILFANSVARRLRLFNFNSFFNRVSSASQSSSSSSCSWSSSHS